MHQGADAVVIERLFQSHRALDRAHADQTLGRDILHHEQIVALLGCAFFSEGSACGFDPPAQHVKVGLERGHAIPDLTGKRHQSVQILLFNSAYYQHGQLTISRTTRNRHKGNFNRPDEEHKFLH